MRVKVEAPTYDGTHDPNRFLDWLVQKDDFFHWYRMVNYQIVYFVKMKLVEYDGIY